MQAVTHLAAGAAIAAWLRPHESRARLAVATALAALSHVPLDDLALATYHPPRPLLHDPFWIAFHAAAWLGAALVAWRWRASAVVLAAALLPDLDWVLARPTGLWEPGALHAAVRALPGMREVSGTLRAVVPDLRAQPAAAAVELAIVALLLALAHRAQRRAAPTPADAAAASLAEG
ncbi:MAG: hypothetical protein D6776_09760 [Planctomycetota bacterium]|nr:MAG: hypothetical protein D6776_09760 [Planctomycetota bacterium]